MLIVTTYTVKPFTTKEETAEPMAAFAEQGAAPGEIAHYVNTDGGGGVITEADDILPGYRNNLMYAEWLESDSKIVVTVDSAVGPIMEALA
jgi:hypothetical protein